MSVDAVSELNFNSKNEIIVEVRVRYRVIICGISLLRHRIGHPMFDDSLTL